MGTTALVIAMCDHQLKVGDPVRLDSPVDAMRRFAADPTCQVAVKRADNRGSVTAIAIQRHYLQQVESHLTADFMPPWASAVCQRWRTMLDQLETGAESVSTQIDWVIKFKVYREWVRRHSAIPWESLPIWTDAVAQVKKCASTSAEDVIKINQAFIKRHQHKGDRIGNTIKSLNRVLAENGQIWKDLDKFQTLRTQLFELDTRFGEVRDRGIFRTLDAEGVLNHRLLNPGKLEQAINDPPTVGRPYVRGRCVKRLTKQNQQYFCTWEGITAENRHLDLSDPFESKENWTLTIPI